MLTEHLPIFHSCNRHFDFFGQRSDRTVTAQRTKPWQKPLQPNRPHNLTFMSDIISEVINRKLVLKTLQAIQEQKTNLLPIHDLAAHLIISIEQQLENSFKKEQPRTTTTTASNPNQHNPNQWNPNPNQHNPNPNQHNPNPNPNQYNPKASTGKASITSFSSAKTKVLELLESMTLLSSSSTGSDVVEFYHLVYNSTTAAQGKSSTPPSDKSFKSMVDLARLCLTLNRPCSLYFRT